MQVALSISVRPNDLNDGSFVLYVAACVGPESLFDKCLNRQNATTTGLKKRICFHLLGNAKTADPVTAIAFFIAMSVISNVNCVCLPH